MGAQPPYRDREATFDAFARHVNRGKADTFASAGMDVIMGARSGATFGDAFDPERRWYNCHCNGGVFNLGHRNERVLAAVRAGLDHLDIGNHHLVSGLRAQLAERLAATTGDRLTGVVFGVAGGEAIDLAIKVARWATGRQGVISAKGGYHGHTGLSMAAGDPKYREVFGPNPAGFRQVPFDDLTALERSVNDTTAAVLLEPIPATLGMPIPSPGYLAAVQDLCAERGAKLILDEVQTGLGRTGRIWCYQHDDLDPDLVVTGKGLSGSIYPIAATLMKPELHRLFDDHPFVHISTFGGAELGCLAALTVLDIIEEPGFCERVTQLSDRFAAGLAELPFELRRRGLMMGIKLPLPAGGMIATAGTYEHGLFCVYANNDTSVLQFLPPLTLTDDEADEIITRLRSTFA